MLNQSGCQVLVLYSTLLEGYSLALYKLGIRAALRWVAEMEDGTVGF